MKLPSASSPIKLPHRDKLLALGDIHFPFHHSKALSTAIEFAKEYQPKTIVQVGDIFDLFSVSRFRRSRNVIRPADEVNEARQHAEWFWARLKKACPRSRLILRLGNHDTRAAKYTLERAPELESWILEKQHALFTFDGVETIHCEKEELDIDGVRVLHGYTSLGGHVRRNLMNCVVGHTHWGGVIQIPQARGMPLWELNCGWLGNRLAPVFDYRQQRKLQETSLGVGTVDTYGPRFIPFPQD